MIVFFGCANPTSIVRGHVAAPGPVQDDLFAGGGRVGVPALLLLVATEVAHGHVPAPARAALPPVRRSKDGGVRIGCTFSTGPPCAACASRTPPLHRTRTSCPHPDDASSRAAAAGSDSFPVWSLRWEEGGPARPPPVRRRLVEAVVVVVPLVARVRTQRRTGWLRKRTSGGRCHPGSISNRRSSLSVCEVEWSVPGLLIRIAIVALVGGAGRLLQVCKRSATSFPSDSRFGRSLRRGC
jgi:hypothetical protein